jgi:hypothetical protein
MVVLANSILRNLALSSHSYPVFTLSTTAETVYTEKSLSERFTRSKHLNGYQQAETSDNTTIKYSLFARRRWSYPLNGAASALDYLLLPSSSRSHARQWPSHRVVVFCSGHPAFARMRRVLSNSVRDYLSGEGRADLSPKAMCRHLTLRCFAGKPRKRNQQPCAKCHHSSYCE